MLVIPVTSFIDSLVTSYNFTKKSPIFIQVKEKSFSQHYNVLFVWEQLPSPPKVFDKQLSEVS